MQSLKIAYVQTDLHWQQPLQNQVMLVQKIAQAAEDADLVVLPEMFLTGFSMAPETAAEAGDTDVIQWLLELSARYSVALCGSIAVCAQDEYRNRFLFVTPEGKLTRYDKRHLFTMGGEDKHYQSGESRVLIRYRGWRILPTICYDLRFPVWCRNRNEYDLMICVANWPAARREAWRILLQARAIENQSYVIGVNRIGTDGRGLEYSGDSLVVNFKGELLEDSAPNQPHLGRATLSLDFLEAFKEKFPVWADADMFSFSRVKTIQFDL